MGIFNDKDKPTKVQIYPEAKNLSFTLTAEWILDFEGELVEEGDARWPGSVVWRRRSYIFGNSERGGNYDLVQVMSGSGDRIEPAWSEFVKYQSSEEAGGKAGQVFYRE